MRLVALEFLIRRELRIAVAEADNETDGDLVVFQVIEETAAIGVRSHRPAAAMDDQAQLVLLGRDFPQFLQADAVGLRIGVPVQGEFFDQLLAEVAAAAFGEKGVFAVQLHARLEGRAFAYRRAGGPCRRWRRP